MLDDDSCKHNNGPSIAFICETHLASASSQRHTALKFDSSSDPFLSREPPTKERHCKSHTALPGGVGIAVSPELSQNPRTTLHAVSKLLKVMWATSKYLHSPTATSISSLYTSLQTKPYGDASCAMLSCITPHLAAHQPQISASMCGTSKQTSSIPALSSKIPIPRLYMYILHQSPHLHLPY